MSDRASLTDPNSDSWLLLEKKKHGSVRCPNCHAAYFDGHWHRAGAAEPAPNRRGGEKLCDACQIERGAHGAVGAVGELRIRMIPPMIREQVLQTIRNVGTEALRRDPEERIIAIAQDGDGLLVTTTENQLVVRIGKKLDSAFKGGKLSISYSDQDLPIRAVWEAPDGGVRK